MIQILSDDWLDVLGDLFHSKNYFLSQSILQYIQIFTDSQTSSSLFEILEAKLNWSYIRVWEISTISMSLDSREPTIKVWERLRTSRLLRMKMYYYIISIIKSSYRVLLSRRTWPIRLRADLICSYLFNALLIKESPFSFTSCNFQLIVNIEEIKRGRPRMCNVYLHLL